MTAYERVLDGLADRGMKACFASPAHIERARERVNDLRREGLLTSQLLGSFFDWVDFDLPRTGSVLVVAHPEPAVEAAFHWQDRVIQTRIPPTYAYNRTCRLVEEALTDLIPPHTFSRAKLPAKTLAVIAGLAQYGRNNICYVEGMGSFVSLLPYCTDIPFDADTINEQPVMPACQTCRACLHACPTGSIMEERFLINADRCLTALNENPGLFPEWVDPAWHNAIIGCVHCQLACPANKDVAGWALEHVEFSPEETEAILDGTPWESLPGSLREKLEDLGLAVYDGVLKRNLLALIQAAPGEIHAIS